MGSSAHVTALSQKHQILDQQIEEETSKLSSDDIHIQKLKRQKLKIKDEISRLGHLSS